MEMYLVLNAEDEKELYFNQKEDRLIKEGTKKELETIPVNVNDFNIDNLEELKHDIKNKIHKTGKHIHHSLTSIEKANGTIDEASQTSFVLDADINNAESRHLIVEIDENDGVKLSENNTNHIEIDDIHLDDMVKIKEAVNKYSMMYDIVSENLE
jgi:hypothetical protein